ncbi:hypothetical protein LX32DRAFT_45345 [Colletotrichum zoysiae]|uniref:Uncharacterized protein n=1 Tax=Colletotrichum zoysiae TaxID=1216348 RepID=A0AAD9HDC7_9PEZI|nr:hypothetical protein LX32DRAFT_45345 [Colletotrichum zoysiae]
MLPALPDVRTFPTTSHPLTLLCNKFARSQSLKVPSRVKQIGASAAHCHSDCAVAKKSGNHTKPTSSSNIMQDIAVVSTSLRSPVIAATASSPRRTRLAAASTRPPSTHLDKTLILSANPSIPPC